MATAFNRSLRYGDGLFETMFWNGKGIRNEDFHLDRLFGGLQILQFDLSGGFTRSFISEEIKRFCRTGTPSAKSRVRLNVFREDGAIFLPVNNKPVFIMESSPIPDNHTEALRLMIYKAEKKNTGILSNLKTNNYLLNIMAIQAASKKGCDDSLLLNHRGDCCEASSSNLFMIQKGILYTPALSEGCVAGTIRRELLEKLPSLGFSIEETVISPAMLFEMDEVFLTNAIRGIRPVSSIDDQSYRSELTRTLMRFLDTTKE